MCKDTDKDEDKDITDLDYDHDESLDNMSEEDINYILHPPQGTNP